MPKLRRGDCEIESYKRRSSPMSVVEIKTPVIGDGPLLVMLTFEDGGVVGDCEKVLRGVGIDVGLGLEG